MEQDDLTYRIIGLAMQVHRVFGPGLLESIYEKCLCYEFGQAGLPFRRQVQLPLQYGDITFDSGCIVDIIVDGQIILELNQSIVYCQSMRLSC